MRSRPGARPEESAAGMPRWWYRLALIAIVALGIAFLVLMSADSIAKRQFGDPDDLMRLQQVRDWMAGQAWTDVTQYRVSPPLGMPMHWSRLVDVPLAAAILAFRPFVGPAQAEILACVAVPMLTYACIALLMAAITRRLLNSDALALLAAACCAINGGIVLTSHPLRIDHHGWQVTCALGMVLLLLGPRMPGRAAIAGLIAALWMHISLEGILFTAACGGWLGVCWLIRPTREGATLPAFLGAVSLGSLALFLVAHGSALFGKTYCDAVSPVHMVMFAVAAIGTTVCLALAPRGIVVRGIGIATAALLAAATYKLWAPQCGGGPFASLPPLSYRLWYLQIPEGLPFWTQPVVTVAVYNGFPLLGLVGAALGLRHAATTRQAPLLDYAALFAASFAIGLMLMRAAALSNLLAVPGALLLLRAMWNRAMALRTIWLRAPAAAATIVLLNPIAPVAAAISLIPAKWNASPHMASALMTIGVNCTGLDNLQRLDTLPPALILTTSSTSEALIAATHHSAVASGYHRDAPALEQTIRFFTADDATAHAIALRYHPKYVLVCPGDGDAFLYARDAPGGLAARLVAGKPPAWLTPVAVPRLRFARLYAITR
ncbi:hypothetical protein [Sphingomonas abietis]|uniref:AcrB/AcrD/AcrF family protein n=1 Tax=Sphingomonas abietis TaxID=3012344 RepID=A0ABY7NNA8_9SPHN|nr:hypothetical protein [Sphingomonas abietis]WBO22697.1 hypothetical protein PBT88_00645 [Sphingomonas abietis]